ncbi:MAG: hypothetical protein DELT_01929 [Desulfovibrio sp.]
MRAPRFVIFFLCCLIFSGTLLAPAGNANGTGAGTIEWQPLEPGLDMAKVALSLSIPAPFMPPPVNGTAGPGQGSPALPIPANMTVLRIDPARFSFALYMASEKGRKTLAEVCKDENFAAAINAGMFLPDRMTNTGHLRQGDHANNSRVAANFGAFFMAEPLKGGLPRARLVDRNAHDWQTALSHYSLVMQNYRMTTAYGRVIWKQAERLHSIAALSQDTRGNILFIFCPDPVPAADFLMAFLALPFGASSVMYLEGGSEAALVVSAGGVNEMQTGRHASGLWSGGAKLEIPNVLGIRRRTK